MKIKAFIKKIARYLTVVKRKRHLKVGMPTVIARDCVAGAVYHDLKQKFTSPTINLYIKPRDFINLVNNLKEYVSYGYLTEFKEDGISFPVGLLSCEGLQDVTIYFMHYKTFNEAQEKWHERCKRINFDNIVVVLPLINETEDISSILQEFNKLPYKKVALLNYKQQGVENTYQYSKDQFDCDGSENLLSYKKSNKFLQWRYLDYFDYVEFINSGKIQKRNIR